MINNTPPSNGGCLKTKKISIKIFRVFVLGKEMRIIIILLFVSNLVSVFGQEIINLPQFDSINSTVSRSIFNNSVNDNGVIIPIILNGVILNIILDTGWTSGFTISEDAAAKTKIQVLYTNSSTGKSIGTLSHYGTAKIPESFFTVGQMKINISTVFVAPKISRGYADGIIGVYDLKDFKIDIRPDQKTVSFDKSIESEPDANPLTKKFIRNIVTKVILDGEAREVLLDTGNDTSCNILAELIPIDKYFKNSPPKAFFFNGYFPYIRDFEGNFAKVSSVIQMGSVNIANIEIKDLEFFQSDWGVGRGIDANIGWQLLKQFRIILNLKTHEISLRRIESLVKKGHPKGKYLINTDGQIIGFFSSPNESPSVNIGDQVVSGYDEYNASLGNSKNRGGSANVKIKSGNKIFEASLYTGFLFPISH